MPYVYIMTNRKCGTLYTGVTSDLIQRCHQHREGLVDGFTKRYGLKQLVWYEAHEDMMVAIQREKNIKHWSRQWKIELIEKLNPHWDDLYEAICG